MRILQTILLSVVLGFACAKTVESEQSRWSRNEVKAGEYKVKYPFAAAVIDQQILTARVTFDAASSLSGDAAIQEMSKANVELERVLNPIESYERERRKAENLQIRVPGAAQSMSVSINNANLMLTQQTMGTSLQTVIGAFRAAKDSLRPAIRYAEKMRKNTSGTVPPGGVPGVPGATPPGGMPAPPGAAPIGTAPGSGTPGAGIPAGTGAAPGSGAPGTGTPPVKPVTPPARPGGK